MPKSVIQKKSDQARVEILSKLKIKSDTKTSGLISQKADESATVFPLPKDLLLTFKEELEKVKGHSVLIDAISYLHKNIHLVIAGDGSLKNELTAYAKEIGVSQRVHFIGHTDDMKTFYQALDVFCLPSYLEGMPLAPLEAQACGIPAVITDTGGAAEALCGDIGQLVTPGDSKALSVALSKVLLRKERLSPRRFVEANGNAQKMAEAYAKLCHITPSTEGRVVW